jgi:hypothetical protein
MNIIIFDQGRAARDSNLFRSRRDERGYSPSHRTSGASEVNKVILYYKFVPVADPAMTMRWQKEVCSRLGLKGRIIISKHGINGTLGGDIENLREYKREMNRSIIF